MFNQKLNNMKNKLKLTDLSHLKPLDEEMSHLKGGDDPEKGPLCGGCTCTCQCKNNNDADTTGDNSMRGTRNNGNGSWYADIAVGAIVAVGLAVIL